MIRLIFTGSSPTSLPARRQWLRWENWRRRPFVRSPEPASEMWITSNDCWAANGLALSLERDEADGGNANWAQANGWKTFGIRIRVRAGFAELR